MLYALECRFYKAHVHEHRLKSETVKPTFLCTRPRDLLGVLFDFGLQHDFVRQAVNFIYLFFSVLIEPKLVDNKLVVVYNCIFCVIY